MNWIKEAGESLLDEPQDEQLPEITEIDELQMPNALARKHLNQIQVNGRAFVGNKRNQYSIWTVVNHQKKGIIIWTIGDRSHQTFAVLWSIIKCWHSFWYLTDGWKVYPMYIEPEEHLISKTYMTRVEGENTRLRHYLV